MRPLPALLLLAACAAPSTTPNARYTGVITPDAPSALCKPGRAVLDLRNGQALFTPDEGTWSLPGTVSPSGTVQAERIGRGADKKPYPTRLTAAWTTQAVTGTYTTPRCAYAVSLSR